MNQEIVTKKCSKCQEIKNIGNFHFRKKRNKYYTICKYCRKIQTRQLKLNNIEHYTKYNKNYKQSHKKERNLKLKNIRKNNIDFSLLETTRSRINVAIKNNSKSGHTLDLLGHTIIDNRKFIENQFYNNMMWKTRGKGLGKWQIHHICPLEFFDLTDPVEQKQACHYSNTQPLWYEDHCEIHRKINERMSQYENNGRLI